MNGGIMKLASSAGIALAALLLLSLSSLAAQNSAPSPADGSIAAPETGDVEAALDASVNPFLPGEQTIGLSAGLHIPAFLFPETGGGIGNLGLGASFSFSYQYFVARGFGLGGNIAGSFNSTVGGQSVFVAPLGVTASYWWSKLPFEFSVLGEAGAYMMRYNGEGIIDPFAKVGGGAYWRATTSWSLGLQAYLWFVPEIHYGANSGLSQYGGFVETSIAAVYHL
jgi:hypothetical protein